MAAYPRIISADANRVGGQAIGVQVMAEVSNSSQSTLWESHEVAGDRLLIIIHQQEREAEADTPRQSPGRRELQFQIDTPPLIRYVDIYGGDYDTHNARRVILPWRAA